MLDRIGSRYGKRPSEILGVSNEFVAFQFDFAIAYFANQIEQGKYRNKEILKKKQDDGFEQLLFAKAQADKLKGVK